MLVASTGGHLEQMWRLRRRFDPQLGEVQWATFDEAQSRSLLAGETVHHVPYIPPRGYGEVARAVPLATQILRRGGYDRVLSTGAGIALAFLPAARSMGLAVHYIESAARATGPSVTGKVVSRVPGTHLYAQYRTWAGGRWHYEGSLFDGYRASPKVPAEPARRIVVTLGTMRRYGFRRAVENLVRVLPEVSGPGTEVLWQVGASDCNGLGVSGEVTVPAARLAAAIADADLVIAHAGIGSCLTALDAGICPVLLPRRPEYHEHVDTHQELIAAELDRRGLAVRSAPEDLRGEDLRAAMSRRIVAADSPTPFHLLRT